MPVIMIVHYIWELPAKQQGSPVRRSAPDCSLNKAIASLSHVLGVHQIPSLSSYVGLEEEKDDRLLRVKIN